MRVLVCLAALLVIVAAIEDVEELEDHAASDPYNDGSGNPFSNPVGGTGYFPNGVNFPGPKYGLPGYKESHGWEGDYDIMSPLVFDYRMYGALIDEPLKAEPFNEEDLKTHWLNKISSSTHGDCPQGNLWFNANHYLKLQQSSYSLFTLEGSTCDVIFKVFLTEGVYKGDQIWKVPTEANAKEKFPLNDFYTMGAKLFNPLAASSQLAAMFSPLADDGTAPNGQDMPSVFQVGNAFHFKPPPAVSGMGGDVTAYEFRTDRFYAARHMTLVWWMKVGSNSEAPNAELFGYGKDDADNFFRTGWGCIDNNFSLCYWIVVFNIVDASGNARGQYFHTYKDSNAEKMSGFSDWTFVYFDLSTHTPNFNNKGTGCESNIADLNADAAAGGHCTATFGIHVGTSATTVNTMGNVAPWGQHITIIDWTDGSRDNAPVANVEDGPIPFSSSPGSSSVWVDPIQLQYSDRRFWISPAQSCEEVGGIKKCAANTECHYKWMFPWHGAYIDGVWFCDFTNIPSGAGGFGKRDGDITSHTRRTRAREALYLIMMDTQNLVCNGDAAVQGAYTPGTGKMSTQAHAGSSDVRL